jgi:hypothetical protein
MPMLRSVFAAALAVAVATPAAATTARLATHDELVADSALVVLGTATSVESFWREGRIFTRYRVSVEQVILGDGRPGDELDVLTLGGVVGGIGQHVEGAARLSPGKRQVLYLARDGGALRPVAMWQGVFTVLDDGSVNPRVERGQVNVNIQGPRAVALPLDLDDLRREVDAAARRTGRVR